MKKQAILIIVHNNLWNLKKIIESLDSVYFDFFVHIDTKSNIEISDLDNICKISSLYAYKKMDIRWADFSQVKCELFLMKMVKQSNYEYEFLHLISGVDMPIKSASEIYNFFNKYKGKEFVHFQSKMLSQNKTDWIKYYHFCMKNYRTNYFSKKINKLLIMVQKLLNVNRIKKTDYEFVTGANWFSITNNFANYVISKEKEISRIFRYTRSADEIFLQTILYNSKFKENLFYDKYDDNYISCMRLIDWKHGSPYIWKTSDYDEIITSDFMFARKFDINSDKKIIEMILKKNLSDGDSNEKSWNFDNK